ncbi:hypothetical protein AKJ57_02855 [candidate division MSBL1 archaeon SCGC-AAA259A05]|uniref:Uncharacterized protein n=1 Tax=candidate division MSBL1 archaeon SCGC-AAA259A05 TaxID=1698259 RepID=A0A133UA05_9EURY|nr:hypothetical protein AKJ57_02855 [candidate division MSBL1 archaeon SCGC-AAA259A05]
MDVKTYILVQVYHLRLFLFMAMTIKVGWQAPKELGGGLWTLKPPIDGLGGAPLAEVENSFMSSRRRRARVFTIFKTPDLPVPGGTAESQ